MPLLLITCPLDGTPLEVSLELLGDRPYFHLATSPAFVAHMNSEHGGNMDPVDTWPPTRDA